MATDKFLFVEKYRPKTIEDCILPKRLKEYFSSQVKNKSMQNMLFLGPPGTGKCLGYDTEIEIMINDEVYEKIKDYCI